MRAVQRVLLTSFLLSGSILAAAKSRPELSILLQPENVVDGVPQAFTFVLTNISDQDIHLPQPDIDCSNPTSQGAVWLNESWQPSTGTGLGKGIGTCDFGGTSQPPVSVIELAKKWTLLRVGESVYITASSNSLHYETSKPGIYTFSATYLPPMLSNENRLRLKGVGIVVPEQKAFSENIQYRK